VTQAIAIRDVDDYLAKVARVRELATRIENIADAKVGADLAATYRVWAERARLGEEKVNLAVIAQIECLRRGGQVRDAVPPARGVRRPVLEPNGTRTELQRQDRDAGLSVWTAKVMGDLADIPEEKFQAIVTPVEGERLSIDYVLKRAKTDPLYSSDRGDWATPQRLFDLLNEEFDFDLDVCAMTWSAKCARYYTPDDDALRQVWATRCFMNPPYGRTIDEWIQKAWESAEQDAELVVCLVPARVDTDWWWSYCRHGEVRFLKGRLHFDDGEDAAPFPSAVVIFGRDFVPSVVWWEAWPV
jgi:phage N-6-adenine-methyltransferase